MTFISAWIESRAMLLLQFDFSKAFITISPSELLVKLQSLGFTWIALPNFWSYLCRRSQSITIKSSSSDFENTNFGVVCIHELKAFLDETPPSRRLAYICLGTSKHDWPRYQSAQFQSALGISSESDSVDKKQWPNFQCEKIQGNGSVMKLYKGIQWSEHCKTCRRRQLWDSIQFDGKVVKSCGVVLNSIHYHDLRSPYKSQQDK